MTAPLAFGAQGSGAPSTEPEPDPAGKRLRKQAAEMAHAIGIAFYVRNGAIHQHPPGERFEPPPQKKVEFDSRFGKEPPADIS